ncbi:hypothetical protein [Aquibacillus saliphilus]|uniref:hypothetical protein n=1 Tax=Aquibacillus saliphilus TaxID=1909422 RepID=UPI001CF01043|nr:hypothetical protein [Aquibacillus saliphilus]
MKRMTSALTLGAAGAAIYGIRKGVQNGTFERLPKTINNALNSSQVKQVTHTLQKMRNRKKPNEQPVQTVAQQEAKNNNAHFEQW